MIFQNSSYSYRYYIKKLTFLLSEVLTSYLKRIWEKSAAKISERAKNGGVLGRKFLPANRRVFLLAAASGGAGRANPLNFKI
ncbi:MAG: hypothetical protein A3E07_01785 [Candidatus Wildermuthbacteria bacterium RIFCSPHIGHO2_12_FULL_45_9]|nr:MAG: hypothetical protein A3E07_01785 [Candidatus Wildermuthbacteria bacterium RIFCSPHIGHO2_12_FULL_45_9]